VPFDIESLGQLKVLSFSIGSDVGLNHVYIHNGHVLRKDDALLWWLREQVKEVVNKDMNDLHLKPSYAIDRANRGKMIRGS